MMSSTLLALLCIAPATAMLRGHGRARGKVQSDMRPEVVSALLNNVEQKWVQGRMLVLQNVTDDASSYVAMEASCLKVSTAIVAGSEGEKDRVVEYMQDVCGSSESKTSCLEFAAGMEGVMTDDESFNRDGLDLKPFCKKFWEHTVSAAALAAKQKLDAEEAKKAEEEKKRADAEAKKLAEEAAQKAKEAADKKAAEDAAAKAKEEADKKAAEEAAAKEAAEKAQEAAEVKAQEAASKAVVVEQNATVATETQSNTTVTEAQTDAQPSVEVPQTNATSAVVVESVAAPANSSEPIVAAAVPAKEVKNVTATETKVATDTKPAPAKAK